MNELTPLEAIEVPTPRPSETYTISRFGREFSFADLKHLLGAADFSKAGDRNARLAAESETVRENR